MGAEGRWMIPLTFLAEFGTDMLVSVAALMLSVGDIFFEEFSAVGVFKMFTCKSWMKDRDFINLYSSYLRRDQVGVQVIEHSGQLCR